MLILFACTKEENVTPSLTPSTYAVDFKGTTDTMGIIMAEKMMTRDSSYNGPLWDSLKMPLFTLEFLGHKNDSSIVVALRDSTGEETSATLTYHSMGRIIIAYGSYYKVFFRTKGKDSTTYWANLCIKQ